MFSFSLLIDPPFVEMIVGPPGAPEVIDQATGSTGPAHPRHSRLTVIVGRGGAWQRRRQPRRQSAQRSRPPRTLAHRYAGATSAVSGRRFVRVAAKAAPATSRIAPVPIAATSVD